MSTIDTTEDRIISRSHADTDCTILCIGGSVYALVEDGDDECAGYYQEIREGQSVYCPYEGYSYYVEGDELHSMHGVPTRLASLEVNNGDQEIAYYGEDIVELTGSRAGLSPVSPATEGSEVERRVGGQADAGAP